MPKSYTGIKRLRIQKKKGGDTVLQSASPMSQNGHLVLSKPRLKERTESLSAMFSIGDPKSYENELIKC